MNPIVLVDPNGKQTNFKEVFEKNLRQMSNAIKDVNNKINDRLNKIKTEISKTVNAANNTLNTAVNNLAKKLTEIAKKPIISRTQTVKKVTDIDVRSTGVLGDRLTKESSVSTSKGNANGLLNLDVTTDTTGNFDSVTLTTATGQSVGTNGSSITLGQSYGTSEAHVGMGPGIGLGECNFGTSSTTNGVTGGSDVTARPGLGTAAGVAAVLTAPEWGPIVAPLAPSAATIILPTIMNNNQ
jgi:hypothetical protein